MSYNSNNKINEIDRNAKDKGVFGVPIGFQSMEMNPKLLDFLSSSRIFHYTNQQLSQDKIASLSSIQVGDNNDDDGKYSVKNPFYRCIDYPQAEFVNDHIYYEGYFHALETQESIETINPRTHQPMTKPAAPPKVRAFFIAFRKKNKDILKDIANDIKDTSPILAAVIDSESVFSDLAVQLHACKDVVGEENINWHKDALNSTLHLAVSIHGNRVLHYSVKHQNQKESENVSTEQNAGNVYVSNPAFFRHGLEYKTTSDWENRVIAIQARLLLTEEELEKVYEEMIKDQIDHQKKKYLGYSVAKVLESSNFQMPTYDEVRAIYVDLCSKIKNDTTTTMIENENEHIEERMDRVQFQIENTELEIQRNAKKPQNSPSSCCIQ